MVRSLGSKLNYTLYTRREMWRLGVEDLGANLNYTLYNWQIELVK